MYLRAASNDRLVKVLGEVLLSLRGPSRKVGPQTSDALPNDVKGPIILRVAGPEILGVVVPSDGRKPL